MSKALPDASSVIFDAGELVLAADDPRVVTGLLLPFGVEGHTNIGGFTVDAGVIGLPADPSVVTLNIGHDREQPVGRAIAIGERADGVYASYRIAKTPEGDQALADIKSRKRHNLSMEAKGVIVKAGRAVAGRIFGSGLVDKPAFEGATVLAEYDPEHGIYAEQVSSSESESTDTYTYTNFEGRQVTTTTTTETTSTTEVEDEEPEDPAEEDTVSDTATVPDTVLAGKAAPVKSETSKQIEELNARIAKLEGRGAKPGIRPEQAFSVMASVARGERVSDELHNQVFRSADSLFTEAQSVYAAQTNITDPIANQDLSPQWLGEFWGRVAPKPKYSDLFTPKTLTSRKVQGFRWTNLPSGASWAGNGAEIHSGAVSATATDEYSAQYFAGGNTVSRENFDFGGGAAFTEWYFGQQALNVQMWIDSLVKGAIVEGSIDNATVIAGPKLSAAAAVPSNIDAGTSALVDAVVAAYTARNELPDFVLLDQALYTTMLKAPATAVLGYLAAALNVTSGEVAAITVRPAPTADLAQAHQGSGAYTNGSGTNRAIKAVAGFRLAIELFTLPGSPFQAQTVNVANGLINLGAYAYALAKPNGSSIAANISDGLFGVY